MSKPSAPAIRDTADRFQRETRDAIRRIQDSPLSGAVVLQDVALDTSTTRVYHRLGRPAVGFLVVDATAEVNVWRDGSFATSPDAILPLVASAPATVTLLVF